MIGTVPAISVRHERRNKAIDKEAVPGLLGPSKNIRF